MGSTTKMVSSKPDALEIRVRTKVPRTMGHILRDNDCAANSRYSLQIFMIVLFN